MVHVKKFGLMWKNMTTIKNHQNNGTCPNKYGIMQDEKTAQNNMIKDTRYCQKIQCKTMVHR